MTAVSGLCLVCITAVSGLWIVYCVCVDSSLGPAYCVCVDSSIGLVDCVYGQQMTLFRVDDAYVITLTTLITPLTLITLIYNNTIDFVY
jgi:hypothetical protein